VDVYGHRGSRLPGPENTAAAVSAAFAAGAHGVEVDIRRSADGVLVCCHDPQVADRAIHLGTARELAALGICPLSDVLDAAHGRGLVVCEIKNNAWEATYDGPRAEVALELLRVLGERSGDEVLVSSFDWFSLEAVRGAGGPATAFLTPPGVALRAAAGYAAAGGHAQVHPHLSDVLAEGSDAVAGVLATGIGMSVWTVSDPGQLPGLAALGVPAVICDDPAACLAALTGLQPDRP
jgi:glycerophosphoryl diester phosphodiesterase